jgi:hypothetical protein
MRHRDLDLRVRVAHRRGGAAFSLIGILLVMAIVLWLMFGANSGGKTYMETVRDTKKQGDETAVTIQTQQLALLLTMYRDNNNGKLPKTVEDLGEDAAAFNDPWGRPLRFELPPGPERDARSVTVISDGKDGVAGTEDDIRATVALN